jgi:hypothetical protein
VRILTLGFLLSLVFLVGCRQKSESTVEPKNAINSENAQTSNSSGQQPNKKDEEVLPAFTEQDAKELLAITQRLIDENEIRIPHVWDELPDWLPKDLPFDAKQYFKATKSDSGSQLYLKAAFRTNPNDCSGMILGVDAPKLENMSEDQARLWSLQRRRSDQYYFFLLSKQQIEGVYPEELARFLQTYEKAILDLANAQKLSFRNIVRSFDIQTIDPTSFIPSTIASLLELRAKACNHSESSIRDLEIGLGVARDFGKLCPYIGQLNCVLAESICLDEAMLPRLRRVEKPGDIDPIIAVLHEHVSQSNKMHRFVEAARQEYFMLGTLLNQIKTGQLKADNEISEMLSIPNDTPVPLVAHKLLIHLEFYSGNEREIERSMKLAAKLKNEPVESIRKTIDAAKKPYDSGIDSMLLMPAIMSSVQSMTETDFKSELDVLAQRCRDAETASQAKYPKRIELMKHLERNWTADPSWKKTKFLKWYQPREKLAAAEIRSDVKSRAYLCLAAVRKWQLENKRLPENVEVALKAAGIPPAIAVDPFTGQAFKILDSKKCGVYSVGPDLVDDLGKIEHEFHRAYISEKGDIVFDLAEETVD